MWGFHLFNASQPGEHYGAKVNNKNALKVYHSTPSPDDSLDITYELYKTILDNMNVDGSVTSQTFTFQSDPDYNIYLMKGLLVIIDGSISQSKFGAISKLTTGIDITLFRGNLETKFIEKAKTNAECFIQSGAADPIGKGGKVNTISNFSGSDDAYLVTLPFRKYVPEDKGLRLRAGSGDKLIVTVNDKLTKLVNLQLYLFYYKHVSGA